MKATDREVSASATFRATVDFPLPDPPAIPIMSGLDTPGIYVKRTERMRRIRNWTAMIVFCRLMICLVVLLILLLLLIGSIR